MSELTGGMSEGETYAEAVENAMRVWIETAREFDREIPVPRGRRLQFA